MKDNAHIWSWAGYNITSLSSTGLNYKQYSLLLEIAMIVCVSVISVCSILVDILYMHKDRVAYHVLVQASLQFQAI